MNNIPSTRKTKSSSTIQQAPKTKQSNPKNPTMNPNSTAPVSAADKEKNVTVETLLKEQQNTCKGSWNYWRGRSLSWNAISILHKQAKIDNHGQ